MSSTMLLLIIMLFTFMAGWQLTMGSSAIRLGRLWWKFPRQTMTWDIEHKLLWVSLDPEKRDELWRRKYRMSYPLFLKLVDDSTPFIQKKDTFWRKAIEPDRATAFVLYRLAHGAAPSEVADMFNVGAATVVQNTKLITKVLATDLYSQ